MTTLYQPIDGYCYNSDTIFLYDFISFFKPKGAILEVGSGCGVLGILVARDFNIQLFVVEVQQKMSFLTQINSKNNNIPINLFNMNFLDFQTNQKFDFIISNPPFYHENVVKSENEMINIARYNNHLPIKEFLKKCSNLLTPRGELIFCYDSRQLSSIFIFAKEVHLNIEHVRFIHSKIDRSSQTVLIRAKKSSKSVLNILPPFVVFDENSVYTKEAQDIFKKANTYTIKCDL